MWDDLVNDAVVAELALVEGIADRLRKFRLCIVAGPEGRGKTSLARLVGFTQLSQGRTVFHVDLSEPGGEAVAQLAAAIAEMDHASPLYLMENAHGLDDSADLTRLLEVGLSVRFSQFLFTERNLKGESAFDQFEFSVGGTAVTRPDIELRLRPTAETVRAIITKHIQRHGQGGREVPTAAQCAAILRTCGGNLRILSAYLAAWETGPFNEIPKERMLQVVYRRRLGPLDPTVRSVLVAASSVAQFGLPVFGPAFGLPALERLAELRVVARVPLTDYFTLPHYSDAAINIEAWAHANKESVARVMSTAMSRYLGAAAPNVGELFGRLQLRAELVRLCLNEPEFEAAVQAAVERHIGGMKVHQISSVLEVTQDHPRLRGRLVEKVQPALIAEKLREGQLESVGRALRALDKTARDVAARTRRALTTEDWRGIWLRTPLRELVMFLYRYATAPDVHDHTELAREVLAKLAREPATRAPLRLLSYERTGKLLLIVRLLGGEAKDTFPPIIAEELDLDASREPEKLTLILKELWESGHAAARDRLLVRIVARVPLALFQAERSGRGLAYVLLNLAYANAPECTVAAPAFLRAALTTELRGRLPSWDATAIRTLIWSSLLIDRAWSAAWWRDIDPGVWGPVIRKAKFGDEVFGIIWNLAQLDRELARRAAMATSTEAAKFWKAPQPPHLPLVGLYQWLGARVGVAAALPSVSDAVDTLVRKAEAAAFVFTLRAYATENLEQAAEVAREVLRRLSPRGTDSPYNALTAHPLEDIAAFFRESVDGVLASGGG